jgi:hypothetical protein
MFFATCSVAGEIGRTEKLDVLDHRGCVRWAGDAQRFGESSPPNRLLCALRYGMQPRTPPRKATRCVNDRGEIAVPVRHSHHSKQFDGQLSLSAPDTRPHRSIGVSMRPCGSGGRRLALDHGSV